MSQNIEMGTCSLCGKPFSRTTMTRHLKACGLSKAEQPAKRSFHLFVDGRYAKSYWMHLAVPVDVRLEIVDDFLRQVWLECCGHLSAFTIAGKSYASQPAREFGDSGMGVRISRLLEPGMVFTYEYDFGSTTELNLKVLGVRDGETHKGAVQLLARNDAPQVTCGRCGSQPATMICTRCVYKDGEWFCEICAAEHDCGEEMCLPAVNSPRAGVCAYCG